MRAGGKQNYPLHRRVQRGEMRGEISSTISATSNSQKIGKKAFGLGHYLWADIEEKLSVWGYKRIYAECMCVLLFAVAAGKPFIEQDR